MIQAVVDIAVGSVPRVAQSLRILHQLEIALRPSVCGLVCVGRGGDYLVWMMMGGFAILDVEDRSGIRAWQ